MRWEVKLKRNFCPEDEEKLFIETSIHLSLIPTLSEFPFDSLLSSPSGMVLSEDLFKRFVIAEIKCLAFFNPIY